MCHILNIGLIYVYIWEFCRLQNSLEVLKLELESRGENVNSKETVWERERNIAENGILVSLSANGQAKEYATQFRSFSQWVTGSLDSCRSELYQLLYPTFVYTYVTMIQLEATTDAQDLLTECKGFFLEQTTSRNRREVILKEIHELSKITSPEQLQESSIATNILKQKVALTISSFTYELMINYLRREKLILIASLINSWFALNVVEDFSPDLLSFWSAVANIDASGPVAPRGKLNLELLKDSDYLKYQELELKHKITQMEEVDEESMSKAHISALDSYRAQLTKLLNCGIQSSIPLPRRPALDEEGIQSSMTMKAEDIPSCAFASFINSYDTVNAIEVSSDLKTIVGGFSDSVIRVFNNNKVAELYGHMGPVYSLSLCETKANLLISSSGDGSIRLWSSELMSNLVAYYGHMLPVWDVSFAPVYGHYFVSGGADRTCRLWSTERKTTLRIFAGHTSDVEVVAWHPNCQIVASGSSDNHIRIWDLSSRSCASVLHGHKNPITSLSFSPDGSSLVSGDSDGEIFCWDLARGSYHRIGSHRGPVWCMAWPHFSCDQIATGGDDCCVKLWDIKTDLSNSVCHTWTTKATPVSYISYSRNNILFGAGAFRAPLQ